MTESTTAPCDLESARTILINSCVAALLAGMVMVLIHEVTHLLAGLTIGSGGTLYPFGVDHDRVTGSGAVAYTAISAPIVSLLSGVALVVWQPLRQRGGFWHLAWLWLAFTSLMEGVGYLVITPFGAGDTAATAQALGWPQWSTFLVAVVGVGLMFATARAFTPYVRRYAGDDFGRSWAFAFYPWIVASLITMGLSLIHLRMAAMSLSPGETIAVLMAGNAIFVFAPMSFLFGRAFADEPQVPLGLPPVPVAGLVGLAVMIVLNLLLTRGLHVG